MAMTRKDYEAIAAVIAKEQDRDREYLGKTTRAFCRASVDTLARDLAQVFAAENPRFDEVGFLRTAKAYPYHREAS